MSQKQRPPKKMTPRQQLEFSIRTSAAIQGMSVKERMELHRKAIAEADKIGRKK